MKDFWKEVPGYFDFEDVYVEMLSKCSDGDVLVEVGCYLGKSACFLGERIRDSGKRVVLLCVDKWPVVWTHEDGSLTHLPFEIFQQHIALAGLAKIVVPLRTDSLTAASIVRNELAGVFIDACHKYESVKADSGAWFPKVRSGGILAGHDYGGEHAGVAKAIDERFGSKIRLVGQCWVLDMP